MNLNTIKNLALASLITASIHSCASKDENIHDEVFEQDNNAREIIIVPNIEKDHTYMKISNISERDISIVSMLHSIYQYAQNEENTTKLLMNMFGLMEIYNAHSIRNIPFSDLEEGITIHSKTSEEVCQVVERFYEASIDLGLNRENSIPYAYLKKKNLECVSSRMDKSIRHEYYTIGGFPSKKESI